MALAAVAIKQKAAPKRAPVDPPEQQERTAPVEQATRDLTGGTSETYVIQKGDRLIDVAHLRRK